ASSPRARAPCASPTSAPTTGPGPPTAPSAPTASRSSRKRDPLDARAPHGCRAYAARSRNHPAISSGSTSCQAVTIAADTAPSSGPPPIATLLSPSRTTPRSCHARALRRQRQHLLSGTLHRVHRVVGLPVLWTAGVHARSERKREETS